MSSLGPDPPLSPEAGDKGEKENMKAVPVAKVDSYAVMERPATALGGEIGVISQPLHTLKTLYNPPAPTNL